MKALILLGAMSHQITHIVTTSFLFEPLRNWCQRVHPKLGYFSRCHLCFGTWVSLCISLVIDLPLFGIKSNSIVKYFIKAFGIALIGRVFNECLNLLAHLNQILNKLG